MAQIDLFENMEKIIQQPIATSELSIAPSPFFGSMLRINSDTLPKFLRVGHIHHVIRLVQDSDIKILSRLHTSIIEYNRQTLPVWIEYMLKLSNLDSCNHSLYSWKKQQYVLSLNKRVLTIYNEKLELKDFVHKLSEKIPLMLSAAYISPKTIIKEYPTISAVQLHGHNLITLDCFKNLLRDDNIVTLIDYPDSGKATMWYEGWPTLKQEACQMYWCGQICHKEMVIRMPIDVSMLSYLLSVCPNIREITLIHHHESWNETIRKYKQEYPLLRIY